MVIQALAIRKRLRPASRVASMLGMTEIAVTDWWIDQGTGKAPTTHETIPCPPPGAPEQSHSLRQALEWYGRLDAEDVLRFQRAIRTVRQ